MIENSFHDILTKLRKKNGMTQRELAKSLSVHITSIKNWENGGCLPDAKNVCLLADLFHVTTDYLLGRSRNEPIVFDGMRESTRTHLLGVIQAYINTMPDEWKDDPKND